MSEVNKSSDWWAAMDDETVDCYGGGTGGALYGKAAPTANDLNSLPYPLGNQTLPFMEYEMKSIKGPGRDPKNRLHILAGKLFKDSKWKTYLQGTTYLAKVIANCSRFGQFPTGTMVFHWEDGQKYFNAFGVWAKKYHLEMEVPTGNDSFPFEEQDLLCYDVATASALTKKDFSETGFMTFANFHLGGYHEFGLTGKTDSTSTGLSTSSDYSFKVNGIEYYFSTASDVTYYAVIALMNAATEVGKTTTLPSNIYFDLVGGDLRCFGIATCVRVSAGGTSPYTDLLASIAGVSMETPVRDQTLTYQEFGLSGKTSSTATGLSNTTTYYFKINGTEYNITTVSTTTFTAIIALLNAASNLPAGVSFSLIGGDLRCYGTGIAMSLTAGTTGTDLLASITGTSIEHMITMSPELRKFMLDIELKPPVGDGKNAGAFEPKTPYIDDVEITCEITIRTSLLTLLNDLYSTTPVRNELAIHLDWDNDDTLDSGELLVLHNLRISNNGTNDNDLPEFGLKEYTIKFEMSQNFSISQPTW